MTRLPLALVFAIGCGVQDDVHVPVHRTTFWTDDAVLAPLLESAVSRLATATGRGDIRVGSDGVPVEANEHPEGYGQEVCGLAASNGWGEPEFVQVDPTPPEGVCMTVETVIVHELIHSLGQREHAEEGLFAGKEGRRTLKLSAPSLSKLCEAFNCLKFEAEL